MSRYSAEGAAGATGAAPGRLGLWPTVRSDRLFAGILVGLVGLAWLSLAFWEVSPYSRFLSHKEVGDVAPFSDAYLRLLVFFVAGWTLMTVAMMLPTSLPLVAFFRSLVRDRPNSGSLVSALVVGYLAVWTAFAAVVHANDQGIHFAVHHIGWLDENAWLIAASTFVVAGLFQFSSLKYRCLDKCRSPVGFVLAHWREANAHECLPGRGTARTLLPRLLLGAHAVDVRRRRREHRVDAGAGRRDGDGEERVLGQTAERPSRRPARCFGNSARDRGLAGVGAQSG